MLNKCCPQGVVIFLLCLCLGGQSNAEDTIYSLSTGVEYTRGDYDGDVNIDDIYIPVTVSANSGFVGLRLTVPYLRVKAPTGTIVSDTNGQPSIGSGPETTETGLGDIVGGITFYDVIYDRWLDLAVDVTAKVKLGTADENKGLGTGENDYSVRVDVYKYFIRFYLNGSAGYTVRGDPSGVDLENAWFGSFGTNYRLTSQKSIGITYDYRQSAFDNSDAVSELSGFISVSLDRDWKLLFYALKGMSNTSPDWGAGMRMKWYF